MGKEIIIYSLSDPITGHIKYIGKTCNLKERHAQHCAVSLRKNDKNIWLLSLKDKGLKPIISIIEQCGEMEANEREIYQIKSHIDKGCNLFNKHLLRGKQSRISIVLPDGTKDKLKSLAKLKGIIFSQLVIQLIELGLLESQEERISIVVPDGTIERLKRTADYTNRTQSNIARKFILNGLSFEEPTVYTIDSDGNKNYNLGSVQNEVKK